MRETNSGRRQYKTEHHSCGMMKSLMVVSGWILCAAAFVAGGLTVLGISGKYNLKQQTMSYAASAGMPVRTITVTAGAEEERGKDQMADQNREYRYNYNEDILTFLFMGIDGEGAAEGYADGGRADALFLFVLNPHDETMSLIPINRDTMTEVDVYDAQGNYKNTVTAQVCVQYGFGDGGRESCEYQIEAVSNLFYGIPIHGYLAVDMGAVPAVTELIGGIDLRALADVRNGDREVILRQGELVHLDGDQACWYVRDRDSSAELSAGGRADRQRQFVTALIDKVRRMTKEDLTVPIKIYNSISDRAVTDITVDEVTYLTAIAGGYHFSESRVITVPGRSISGEESRDSGLDEFYVDETALYELILDVFYEPADEK